LADRTGVYTEALFIDPARSSR